MNNTKKIAVLMSAIMLCSTAANGGAAVFAADFKTAVNNSTSETNSDSIDQNNIPEAVPSSEEEAFMYYMNTRLGKKEDYFVMVCIEDEIPEYVSKNGEEVSFYTVDLGKYTVYYTDAALEGAMIISEAGREDNKTAYEIENKGMTVIEEPYLLVKKHIDGIPEAVPYSEEEAEVFYYTKEVDCTDEYLIIVCTEEEPVYKTENGEEVSFNAIDFGMYTVYYTDCIFDGDIVLEGNYKKSVYNIKDRSIVSRSAGFEDYESGDIDGTGVTDLTDLSYLSLYLLGEREFTADQMLAADVTGDGEVDIRDLATLKQYICKDPDVVLHRIVRYI